MTTLIVRPSRDKRPYRLKCRFRIEPRPLRDRLDREKVRIAEWFVKDMEKEGWEHDLRFGFEMKGPFPMVETTTLHPRRTPTAREMLPRVARGERFLDDGAVQVRNVPTLKMSEWWEFEISGVFIRTQIMTERPDAHEEDLRT